jgi:hypothetical protein
MEKIIKQLGRNMHSSIRTSAVFACLTTAIALPAIAEDDRRRIEEVIVTAEKIEATV